LIASKRPLLWLGGVPAACGVALGLACWVADQLPYDGRLALQLAGWFGNIGGTWLVLAFGLGGWSGSYRRAALAGPLGLGCAVVVYYAGILLSGSRDQIPGRHLLSIGALWLGCALAAGLCFALLGAVWRSQSGWKSSLAVGILCGAMAGENLFYLLQTLPYLANQFSIVMLLELAAALILPWLLLRKPRAALAASAWTLALSIFGILLVNGLEQFFRARGG